MNSIVFFILGTIVGAILYNQTSGDLNKVPGTITGWLGNFGKWLKRFIPKDETTDRSQKDNK